MGLLALHFLQLVNLVYISLILISEAILHRIKKVSL